MGIQQFPGLIGWHDRIHGLYGIDGLHHFNPDISSADHRKELIWVAKVSKSGMMVGGWWKGVREVVGGMGDDGCLVPGGLPRAAPEGTPTREMIRGDTPQGRRERKN
jgi:hypothetical protein